MESEGGGGNIIDLSALTDVQLTRKILQFLQQIFTFGYNLPEDEEKYGEILQLYDNEAERRKNINDYKIECNHEELSQFYYKGFGVVDRPKHDPVDKSVDLLELLLGENFTKENHITRKSSKRPSQRSSKKLEPTGHSFIPHDDIRLEKYKDRKWLESIKGIQLNYPSHSIHTVSILPLHMDYLKPETDISTVILDFYITYIKATRPGLVEKKIQIFDTAFYRKLQQMDENYASFRRWWSKSRSLFDNSYILFPVVDLNHFSLGIICIPSNKDEFGPAFVHLDSLRNHHPSSAIYSYVTWLFKVEWDQRESGKEPEPHFRLEDLKLLRPEVPQQENAHECGLFVLKYLERFISDFPQKLRSESDLSKICKNWFNQNEAFALRGEIRDILVKLFDTAKEERKLYLVDYRWWNAANPDMAGILYTASNVSPSCSTIYLCMDKRESDVYDVEKGGCGHEYALISKEMFHSALTWYKANGFTYTGNSFPLQASVFLSETWLNLEIELKDNAAEDFEKSSQLFSMSDVSNIWDFSVKDFLSSGTQCEVHRGDGKVTCPKWSLTLTVYSISDDIAQKKGKMPAGLANLGNTCYINCVIQCFLYTPLLAQYFISQFRTDLADKNIHNTDTGFSLAFVDLLIVLSSNGTEVSPDSFYPLVSQSFPHFEPGTENDSAEFLMCLLDKLHEQSNRATHKIFYDVNVEGMLEIEAAKENWNAYKASEDSVIVDLCRGQYNTTMGCPCNESSSSYQTFSCIPLPLPSRDGPVSLNDCFKEFLKEEVLRCEKCGKNEKISKKNFSRLPKYLMISLNRFESILVEGTFLGFKVDKMVDFPMEFDLADHTIIKDSCSRYKLYAVINHEGKTLKRGHYYAYVEVDKKWYKFNDRLVKSLHKDQITTNAAYVLFYMKIDPGNLR